MAIRCVALLRGVNVGRNKRIAMAQLRDLITALGYEDVSTYLQSGNAIFSAADDVAIAAVAARIEQALADELGLRSTVIVRTAAQLAAIVAANPLRAVATDPARYLVGFLAATPAPDAAATVATFDIPPDRAVLLGSELYLWCPAGVLVSPLGKVAWDRQLGVAVTMRNWTTVEQLAARTAG